MKLQLHAYKICIVYVLVSQGFVRATLLIEDSLHRILDDFKTRDATVNHVMKGYIEYANPSDACSEISQPGFPQNFTMKKIVLINGTTTCNLITKVQNAKQAGYDIAVLFDPSPGSFEYNNITFPLPMSEVNLSVVLVLCEDGIVIRDNYLYHIRDKEHFKINIYPYVPAWTTYLIYFIGAIVASLIGLVFCFIILKFLACIWNSCVYLFGNPNEEQQNVDNARIRALLNVINEENGVQRNEEECRTALSNLRRRCPSEVFSNAHTFEVCVICRYNFEVGENIRVLRCFHAYHTDCIDKWLLYSKETCPMCVARVNLENSCEHSSSNPTESTQLLASTQSLYSSSRTGNNSGPSDAPLLSTDLAEAQGSVNYVHLNESDDDDQQGLMV